MMKNPFQGYQIWFITGSQHLYGEEILSEVEEDSRRIAEGLNLSEQVPVEIVFKRIVTTSQEILQVSREANMDGQCAGIVLWMHTFSPAKMWIAGLRELRKPFAHLHTQFGRAIPWETIDMDYMNLHQSAHGGREFGHMVSRMRMNRQVIVGHWQDAAVQTELGSWVRVVMGYTEARTMKVARFGDNMRNVAVTEGDKVAAQERFGYLVDGYGIGDLKAEIDRVTEAQADALVEAYARDYVLSPECQPQGPRHLTLRNEAKIEIGLRTFLEKGGYTAFTTTFEDLHGLPQLPGLAVQRLMADGYGFGAEGDWKTSAFTRICKVIGYGKPGGTSFMEDYTYHFSDSGDKVLGAHMLEVCPSIAKEKPLLSVQPLGIGGKDDPARLIFTAASGPALNASLIDLGGRFRLVVNTVDTIEPEQQLPRLPVACALWEPRPNLSVAAAAWIYAGAAHHSVYSRNVSAEQLEMLAAMWDIEMILIDKDANLRQIRQELRWNEAAYR